MDYSVANKVQQFFGTYPTHSYAKDQIIVPAGEEPPGVLYLTTGRVNQYDISPTGNEMVVNVYKSPAFFPMSWAINKTPNDYFFQAATTVTVHQAPAAEAVAFLQANPDVMFDLLSRVYQGMEGVLRRTAHLMGGDASSRVLFELLNAAQRFGEPTEQGGVSLRLKESDLAKHAGLARETVSRTLQKLKAKGVVTIKDRQLTIRSMDKLQRALGKEL